MLKRVRYLIGWFAVAWLAAGIFIYPTPPGGVGAPYYFMLLIIPFAVYRHAARLSIAISYGLLCGFFFAWPVFTDGRTGLRIVEGRLSESEIGMKIVVFTFAMTLVCVFGFYLRGFWITFSRNATNDG